MAEESGRRRTGRRDLLVFVALGALALGANRWLNRPGPPEFEPVPGLPAFRRLRAGGVSAGRFDPFIGLDAPGLPAAKVTDEMVCAMLFAGARPGTVPVASFSDYNCPFCRVLTQDLARRDADGMISVTWHELPLLGEASVLAARAALAAARQDAYSEIHARLMRSRIAPDEAGMRQLATGAGLDPDRFVRDAASPAVTEQLALSRGLAARFGLIGTPALVIGRTLVIGAVSPDRLDALIAGEAVGLPECG